MLSSIAVGFGGREEINSLETSLSRLPGYFQNDTLPIKNN